METIISVVDLVSTIICVGGFLWLLSGFKGIPSKPLTEKRFTVESYNSDDGDKYHNYSGILGTAPDLFFETDNIREARQKLADFENSTWAQKKHYKAYIWDHKQNIYRH